MRRKGAAKSTKSTAGEPPTPPSRELVAAQQRLLDVFSLTFACVLSADTFLSTLQHVKQALFNRDFATAFAAEENLEVYAARWSPTRALCYASVLTGMRPHLDAICAGAVLPGEDRLDYPVLKMLAIGGGAAEVVAFGALLRELDGVAGDITLLDSAPWRGVVSKLEKGLTTAPPLSKYASEAAREANAPLVAPARLSVRCVAQDVLAMRAPELSGVLGTSPCVITLLFTLNELFTGGGIGKTTASLLALTAAAPIGSLLLVVDSPGSYSETTVGKQAKRYPMQWLLDKVLLAESDGEPVVDGRRWTKLESQDSVWFRLAETLQYPIALENMRYQFHLYRIEDVGADSKSAV